MLSTEDLKYFDGKFGEVHEKCNEISEGLASHVASPCHEAQKDSTGKWLANAVAILTVGATIFLLFKALLVSGIHP